eukprot:2774_1
MANTSAAPLPSLSQIDTILDEIEETEQKNATATNKSIHEDNWNEITTCIINGNLKYIKNLISTKNIAINAQNPANGFTLLFYAVIIGNLNLVKTLFDFGVDNRITDNEGHDALYYSIKYGRYKLSRLLLYRSLSGSLGNDLSEAAVHIGALQEQAEWMRSTHFYKPFAKHLIDYIRSAIDNRVPFNRDLLFYAWYLNTNGCYEHSAGDPLKSRLFESMMKAFEQILCNTDDADGWKWLKEYLIPSYIWYLPHPNAKNTLNDDDDADDFEQAVKGTLLYELLKRVRVESKKQSDILLKIKIDKIESETPEEWNQLIAYKIDTNHSKNARQDACGCLTPKYNEDDLSEDKYPPSTHFSAKKHYDANIYLNQLVFKGNILDPIFQTDMKWIAAQIQQEIAEDIIYIAGPVKTLTRCQTKVENDYIAESYPASAKLLDINRCALQFKTIKALMKFLLLFNKKIKNGETRSIADVIRIKNGWTVYDA